MLFNPHSAHDNPLTVAAWVIFFTLCVVLVTPFLVGPLASAVTSLLGIITAFACGIFLTQYYYSQMYDDDEWGPVCACDDDEECDICEADEAVWAEEYLDEITEDDAEFFTYALENLSDEEIYKELAPDDSE